MQERVRLLKPLVGAGVNPFSLCNAVCRRARWWVAADPRIRVAWAINRAIGEFASGALTCQAGWIEASPAGAPEATREPEPQVGVVEHPERPAVETAAP